MSEHIRLPVNLNLLNRRVLIVGGGKVGLRKAINLLGTGADIVVVDPEIDSSLDVLVQEEKVQHLARAFEEGDLEKATLVFAATDDAALNERIAGLAAERGIFCNVASDAGAGDFSIPAQIRRGHFSLAISTDGRCPAFSRALRRRLDTDFDQHWATAVELLHEIRSLIQQKVDDEEQRRILLQRVAIPDLPNRIRRLGRDQVKQDLLESIRLAE